MVDEIENTRFEKRDPNELVPDVELGSTLYVTDENLRVIFTNDEWRKFAEENRGIEIAEPIRTESVLDSMSGKAKEKWSAIYGLLLDGKLPHYEEDFICSSPTERRIYRIRITPSKNSASDAARLVHHTIPIDEKADDREAMRRQLRDLEGNPDQVRRAYHEHVLVPRIEIPGFSVSSHLEPHDEVGGDLVWHRMHAGGVADLVIADAMGHGLEAGVHASKIVLMLDALSRPDRLPQDILASLNRGLIRNRSKDDSAFATGIFIRFDRNSSRIRCANFGHQPPLFSRSGSVRFESGLPLGMVDTVPRWPETELDLDEHGSRFVIATDGITEQFDEHGEMYGEERLLEALRSSRNLDLDTMLRRIREDLSAFRGQAIVKDDRTLVAIERDSRTDS